jgi:hypothetical protein
MSDVATLRTTIAVEHAGHRGVLRRISDAEGFIDGGPTVAAVA